nr:beta-defensin 121-like isoform X2 [Oryctolagus cuniculus]
MGTPVKFTAKFTPQCRQLPAEASCLSESSVMKCWGTSGRCRATCKESEIFHILCKSEEKCCVNPKYVPVKPASTSLAKIPLQP